MWAFLQSLDPLYVLSGVLVGGLVGMTGVGGGSLMTPLLILLFHVNPATAVGTDLIYASVTKTGGSLVHGYNRTIDWRIVGRLALGSLPVGRTLRDALHCPNCGAAYNLLVPAEASVTEVEAYCSHLRDTLTESCGMHPPVVQSG